MRSLRISLVVFLGVVYHAGVLWRVDAQHIMESPTLTEMEYKKAMFYNRKPGKDKIKVVYMRVPDDDRPQWRGQAPLNPTGPPPGAYSPGAPRVQERRGGSTRAKRKTGKYPRSKPSRYHPHPLPPPPSSSKTPCPYKLLAEDLMEQKRQQNGHVPPAPPPTASPTPPPTTTLPTTTTTTPAPTTTTPQPSPYLSQSGPQLFYQQISTDPVISMNSPQDNMLRLHQQGPMQFEDIYQSQSGQFPFLLENQPGQVLMHQQPMSQQIVTQMDPFTRTTSQFLVNQQPQQTFSQDSLQHLNRFGGSSGNQMLFDRQQQQSLFGSHQSPQQQLVLLDQSQNSQVAPTTVLLPNGQLVQQSPQTQQQPLLLLNTQADHSLSSGLSFLQQPVLNQRNNQLLGSRSNLQLLSDLNSFNADSSLLMNNLNRRNRKPSIPLIIQSQPEPETSPVVVLHQGSKKSRRPQQSNRERDRKRLVLISKKELEQMKHKKASRPNNVPPPPEVIHIPFHESSSLPQEEYDYEDNGDTSSNYNFPPQLHSSIQSSNSLESVSGALTPVTDSDNSSDDSNDTTNRDDDTADD